MIFFQKMVWKLSDYFDRIDGKKNSSFDALKIVAISMKWSIFELVLQLLFARYDQNNYFC